MNYEKPVSSLLHKFQKAKFSVVSVYDGGEEYHFDQQKTKLQVRKDAVDAICAVDDSWVRMRDCEGRGISLYVVLGNDFDEIVCDYSCSPQISSQVDGIVEEFQVQWEK
jgi:hypothetical protein